MSRPRLFAALALPDDQRRSLSRAAGRLRRAVPEGRLRMVRPRNMHVTLRFFGPERAAVRRERIEAGLRRRLAALDPEPPVLAPSGFSCFPSPHRARVLWAGFRELAPAGTGGTRLRALYRAAERVAGEAGLKPERRRFVPHATLARLRSPTRVPPDLLAALEAAARADPSPVPFPAGEVHLFGSTLTAEGPVHERLAVIPVGGGRGAGSPPAAPPQPVLRRRKSAYRSGPRQA